MPQGEYASDADRALQPSREEIEFLTPTARRLYRFADWMFRRANWITVAWITTAMRVVLWFCGGRRFKIHGQEHLDTFTSKTSAVLVANHRSFFDFYVVMYATVTRSKLSRRAIFPVREDFFYDRWLGGLVNMLMTGMAMFPPITRSKEQMPFNRFALSRLVQELDKEGTCVGIHPEGTRNKGEAYDFLPAQPGVGKLVLEAKNARTIPIFILGMGSNLLLEMWKNWTGPDKWPIYISFGDDIDFTDLRARGSRASTQLLAARRCMEAITELAEQQRTRETGSGNTEETPMMQGT
jgi:1-acyl-sn-glycerol-3-phosphate acyltransferase